MSGPLVCRSCETGHEPTERFCPACGLPLVLPPEVVAAARPASEAQQRARKVRPSYSEGPLVTVAAARHQAEAEFLQGLLLEEGIPSLLRRSGGFDVPDFLAAGPRDILVPESGAAAAREALGTQAPVLPRRGTSPSWVRVLAALLAGLLVLLVLAGVLTAVWP